jgi:hypothetical protein
VISALEGVTISPLLGCAYYNRSACGLLGAFHNPKLSFTAITISWSDPRYLSTVWIEACPSRNLIS